MKVLLFALVMLLSCSTLFAKDVVIFEFYNKEGKNIPSASVGVIKSIMQFAKYYPSANIKESSFDVKGRDLKELPRVVFGYDNYIVGYYTLKNNIYTYEVSIYDNQGSSLTSFSVSSEDLFEIADGIMQKIFSFYSGKVVGFARIVFNINFNPQNTYTVFLNDQVLSSVQGKTNISVRVISKTPYSVIVRDDETKEVMFNKSMILMDNEEVSLNVVKEEHKEIQMLQQSITRVQGNQDTKYLTFVSIRVRIERRDIFDDGVFDITRKEAKELDYSIRKYLYERYSISVLGMIGASALNVIPGLGSLVIGDTWGGVVCLLSPYATLVILRLLEGASSQGATNAGYTIGPILGILTIGGYIYNIIRPFTYASWWNGRLEEVLSLKENVSLSFELQRVSLNIRF